MPLAFQLFLVVCTGALVSYAAYVCLTAKTFVIKEEAREAAVVQQYFSKKKLVLRTGVHTLPFWWIELERISLAREPLKSGTPADRSETINTLDRAEGDVRWEGNIITGQPSDDNGRPLHPQPGPEHADDEAIITAITKLRAYDQRIDQIRRTISGVMQAEFGRYSMRQLLNPGDDGVAVWVLRQNRRTDQLVWRQRIARSAAQLKRFLEHTIQNHVNYKLKNELGVGIHLLDFTITDIRPVRENLREAIEAPLRVMAQSEAVQRLRDDNRALNTEEAFAVVQNQPLAGVIAATAAKKAVRLVEQAGPGAGQRLLDLIERWLGPRP